jgi:hypothetical protein
MLLKLVQFIVFLNLSIFTIASILYIAVSKMDADDISRKLLTSPEMSEFSSLPDNIYKIPRLEDLE